jgi:hypothetical protein
VEDRQQQSTLKVILPDKKSPRLNESFFPEFHVCSSDTPLAVPKRNPSRWDLSL